MTLWRLTRNERYCLCTDRCCFGSWSGGLLGGGAASLDASTGLLILAACLPIAIVGLVSGIHQGKTAAAGIGIVAKKPEQFGKAMLFPAMVETYAILALLISILAVSAINV